ncbi:MAG: hypothetical protein PHP52_09125 [Bacteroidales bacterium]|nr:hypothetical protein [Bacteroidales bacterium]MDD4217773.1 hypothetical protein [Bacteroidales bacterium]MDY0142694.1 hypothetical protein [Bacteroidales bacterium]
MKTYSKLFLIIITTISFGACNNVSTNKEKNTTNKYKNAPQDTIVDKSDIADVVFSETYILKIENIYNGEVVNDLIITSYRYDTIDNPDADAEFNFVLKGEIISDGEIMIDEMGGELAIQFDKNTNPHKNIIIQIEDYQKQVIDFSFIRNPEDLLLALTDDEIQKLEKGKQLKLKLKVKDAKLGGKIDDYGELNVQFVEIIR